MDHELPRDFIEFLNILKSKEAEYLLIGGYAIAIHARPRATDDMDIWIRRSSENAEKVYECLEEFGAAPTSETRKNLELAEQMVRMGHPPNQLEILTTISGVEFTECYPQRMVYQLGDLEIHVIGREDLKKNKRASGRLKDLADLELLGEYVPESNNG